MEAGLYQLLRDDPGVKALIGGRVYMGMLPKDYTLPAVVIQVITTDDTYSTEGADGLRDKKVQFDSYAGRYTDALQASEAVRNLLKSFAGGLPDGTLINGAFVSRDMDFPAEPGTGSSGVIFRRLLELDFMYSEGVTVVAGNVIPAPGAHLRYPAGALDGANRIFTLTPPPLDPTTVLIFLNGQVQDQGLNYSINGATLTLTAAPAVGDDLFGFW